MRDAPAASPGLFQYTEPEEGKEETVRDGLFDSYRLKLPKEHLLKGGSNWLAWSTQVLASTRYHHSDPMQYVGSRDNMRVGFELKKSIAEGPMSLVAHLIDATDIWNVLTQAYAGSGLVLRGHLQDQLYGLTLKGSDPTSYISKFTEIAYRYRAAGGSLQPEDEIHAFLRGTEAQQKDWTARFRSFHRQGFPLTLQGLMADLTDECRATGRAKSMVTQSATTAPRAKGGKKPKTDRECWTCGKKGHISSSCKSEKKKDEAEGKGETVAKPPSASADVKDSSKKDEEKPLQTCSMRIQPEDFEAIQKDLAAAEAKKTVPTVTEHTRHVMRTVQKTSGIWLWDTGANVHTVNDISWFQSYAAVTTQRPIQTGGGDVYPELAGTVLLRFSNGETMLLRDVMYVPNFPMNVFSGERLYLAGGYMRGNDLVGPQGRVFDTLDVPARGFHLSVTHKNTAAQSRVMWTSQQRQETQLWHRRFGHPGHRELMKSIELTRGCSLTAKDIVPQPCATCDMSKSLRYSPRTPRERAQRSGDLIHVDIGEIKPALWSFTAAVKGGTPLQVLTEDFEPGKNSIPDVSNLRVVGSKCFVNIDPETRVRSEKMAPRAEEGILVGYVGTRAYQVWLPERQKVVTSSIVVFHEPASYEKEDLYRSLPPGQGAGSRRYRRTAYDRLQSMQLSMGFAVQIPPAISFRIQEGPPDEAPFQGEHETWPHPDPATVSEARNGPAGDWPLWKEAAQGSYLRDIVEEFAQEMKPADTPVESGALEIAVPVGGSVDPELQAWYRRLVGKIGFASLMTRPDVTYGCGLWGRFSHEPHKQHQKSATRMVSDNRTRHIRVHDHFARETVERGEVSFQYARSEDNVADVLTKPLARPTFERLRTKMGLRGAEGRHGSE
ncbi:hypothetical protein CMUS01_16287 [Colletotrichum musicola]|uniref:CCHC-type domain-containing protein n=1 Tax=Colletotrichum musicola TaxID=2175873 RepID=A0A8H6IPE1_9PEZI|nr:hypothetical protein CMUS01_16287 [Colletotrichum musicola]